MAEFIFVTGTSTGVGKSLAAASLLRAAGHRGIGAVGIKPVATGCVPCGTRMVNNDALLLQAAAGIKLDYEQVNPVALGPPVAPHIAAADAGRRITVPALVEHCRRVAESTQAELIVVEGAGGWLVPANADETLAGLAVGLDAGVVIVVGLTLGCLNHALLTARAIRDARLALVSWVANCLDPEMNRVQANLDTLNGRLAAPCAGVVPYMQQDPDAGIVDECLDWDNLLRPAG